MRFRDFAGVVFLVFLIMPFCSLAAQEWDEPILRQEILEVAVNQCLEEVIFPQNYVSEEGKEEMAACLEKKGVITVGEAESDYSDDSHYTARSIAPQEQEAQENDPEQYYKIPDMDRLVQNLKASEQPAITQPGAEPLIPVQDQAQKTEVSSQGSLYVRSSKSSSGKNESKAKPVFLNR